MIAEIPMREAVEAVDYAAKQSPAYQFVALLAIGIVAIAILTRYFMREIEKLQNEIKDVRGQFEKYLQSEARENAAALTRASQAIEQNSKILVQIAAHRDAPPLVGL